MRFQVRLRNGDREHLLRVERINVTAVSEQFVIANQNDTQQVIIQSNRPFFRNRNMKHRKPDYKVISGAVRYKSVLDEVFKEIMKVMEPPSQI
jgi:hypothetical protein